MQELKGYCCHEPFLGYLLENKLQTTKMTRNTFTQAYLILFNLTDNAFFFFYELKARPSTSKLTLLWWSGPSPYHLQGLPVNALLSWRKTLSFPGSHQDSSWAVPRKTGPYIKTTEGLSVGLPCVGRRRLRQTSPMAAAGSCVASLSGARCFLPVERGQGPS